MTVKTTVAGEALVITLGVPFDDLRKIAKFQPEALNLKDAEGETLYSIAVDGNPGINTIGATFGKATYDKDRYAVITMNVDPGEQDIKEYIADTYGAALGYLEEIAAKLPDVLKEIDEKREAIMGKIEIA